MGKISVDGNRKIAHATRGGKFAVPVSSTPAWKIRAVATYKASKGQIKSMKSVESDNSQSNIESSENKTAVGPTSGTDARTDAKSSKFNVTYENVQRELDTLYKSSQAVKREMIALASIKMNLLWLLRRTTFHETYRNHSHT